MPNNFWFIIAGVGLGALIVGYVLAVIEGRLTSALKDARGETAPGEPAESLAPKIDEHPILKVTIDPTLQWRLDLDGIRVEPDSLTAEQRTRLINVLVQIRPWIDGKPAAPVASAAPVQAPPLAPAPTLTPVLPAAPAGAPPAKASTPRVDVMRGFRSLLESEVKKPEAILSGPSIVSLIDEVLQNKLVNSPLAAKNIRLEEGTGGEVIVYVGATRYSGIDAVPDGEIKSIIQEAIAEWNKK